jgi:hypothetical protein
MLSAPRLRLDRRRKATALAALAVLTAGGCGSTDDGEAASSSESTSGSSGATESGEPREAVDASGATEPAEIPEGSVQGDGYTMAIPEGWTDLSDRDKDVPQLAQADLAYGDTTEQEFASNLNTIVTPAGGVAVSDQGVRDQLADLVEQKLGVRPEPTPDVELDGEKAIGQTARLRSPDASLIQYVTVHDDEAYTLTITLSAARAGEADAIVRGVVDSWKWTED